MDRKTSLIHQRLVSQWDEVKLTLERMNSAAEARPNDGWTIFQPMSSTLENVIEFEVKPIVFNLPERADHVSTDLYVVVQGRMAFRNDFDTTGDVLATDSFSTKAAYFRRGPSQCAHVYGVHYDFAINELGHPVFHSQMRNFPELWTQVQTQYGINVEPEDRVKGLLRNVRLPSAQMDVFSIFIQICADHLLFGQSGPDERAAFNKLLGKSIFLKGAGFRINRLTTEEAHSCYRARHWYPLLS